MKIKILLSTGIAVLLILLIWTRNYFNKKLIAKDLKISEFLQVLKLTRQENTKETIYNKQKPNGGGVFVINLAQHKDRLAKVDKQLKRENIEYQRFNAVLGHDIVITDTDGNKHLGIELKDNKFKFEAGKSYNIKCRDFDFVYYISHKNNILSAGLLGCYCSHYEIINKIIANNYAYGLIFEDDVKLSTGFGDYLRNSINQLDKIPDFDMLYFAVHLKSKGKFYNNFSEMPTNIAHEPYSSGLPEDIKNDNFIKINDRFSKFIISKNIDNRIQGTGAGYAYLISNAGAKKIAKALKIGVYAVDAEFSDLTLRDEINVYVANQSNVGVIWESSYNGKGNDIT